MMRLRLTAAGAVVAVLAAAPGAFADPPALTPIKRCYVSASPSQRESIEVHGSNFSPKVGIDTYLDDILAWPPPGAAPPLTDSVGSIDGSVQAPYQASGQRVFTLRLSEHENAASSATATGKVTALSVEQVPGTPPSTSSKVRFRGRGFTGVGAVYAHWVFRGQSVKTIRIAKPYGACGLFSRKLRQFPFAHPPKTGEWTIAFDQMAAYAPTATLRWNLDVKVKRKPRG